MPEDVKARIVVSVESSDAAKQCDEVQRKLERITAAREKDLKVVNKKTEAIEKQKRAELELTQTIKNSNTSPTGTEVRNTRPGEWRTATPLPHEQAAAEAAEKAAQRQQAIKEEIAASTRALQKQREELGSVNKLLSERGKLSTNELRIEQAAARVTTTEYREQRTALALLRAELKMTNAERNLFNAKRTGEDPRRILALSNAAKQYREDWLKAQQTAADAGLASRKAAEAYERLTNPLKNTGAEARKTSRSMREFSASATAARAAGRLFGIDVSDGVNPALIKQGIIVAGVVSAVKLAGSVYDSYMQKLRDSAELARMNSDSVRKVGERNKELIERNRETLSSIRELNDREKLSNIDKLEMSRLVEKLGRNYRDLGLEIDGTTGKLKNFDKINAEIIKKNFAKEISDNERIIKNLRGEQETQREIMNARPMFSYNAGPGLKINGLNPFKWEYQKNIVREFGGEYTKSDIRAAGKEYHRIGEEISKLNERNFEIRRLLSRVDSDVAKEAEARLKDTAEEQRLKQQKITDAHRERLKSLGKELEIENLLIAGDERRARLAKWQNELEKQGLKPEQLKAELAAREQLHQTQQFRHDWGALAERMRQTPMTRFRETAQSAVMADSLEAVRLQSRVTMQNPEMKILQEQVKLLQEVKQGIDTINRVLGPQRTNPNIKRS